MSDLDAQVAAHMAQVRRLSRAGGPLSVEGSTATMNVGAWFRGGEPTALRRRLHRQLLAEASAGARADAQAACGQPPGRALVAALKKTGLQAC